MDVQLEFIAKYAGQYDDVRFFTFKAIGYVCGERRKPLGQTFWLTD
jgi:hypothetical protein